MESWYSEQLYSRFVSNHPGHLLVRLNARLKLDEVEKACAGYYHQSGPGKPVQHGIRRLVRGVLVRGLYGYSLRETEQAVNGNLFIKWYVGYGVFENGETLTVVANNRGVFASSLESFATYSVTVKNRDGCGWAGASAAAVEEINFDRINSTACLKAAMSRNPGSAAPGVYPVILEPAAAADLLSALCFYGFGGQFYNDGASFACGNLGKKILSGLLSVEDNALCGPAAGTPFDFEGQPRNPVVLVEKGILRAVVHDRKTAKFAKTRSTGHALVQPNTFSPLPMNLRVSEGKSSVEEMIKKSKKAILVTQFHYTNLLRPLNVEMTGMTRNGTFLVENGKISKPLKNLRFTQSLVEAFAGVEAVGSRAELDQGWGKISCPAFKLRAFNFSSATDF